MRSPAFRIDVSDMPYVKQIDLEYRFPAYTGLAPQAQEDTGDVVALRGTEVRVRVTPTMKVAGGRLRVEGDGAARHDRGRGRHAHGDVHRRPKEGFYRIDAARGATAACSPARPTTRSTCSPTSRPSVTLRKPGRDAKVTAHRGGVHRAARPRTTTASRAPSSSTR